MTGQEIVLELTRRGWTHTQIASFPGVECAQVTVDKWAAGKKRTSADYLPGLRAMLQATPPPGREELRQRQVATIRDLLDRGWTIAIISRRLGLQVRPMYEYRDGEYLASRRLRAQFEELLREPAPKSPLEIMLDSMNRAADNYVFDEGIPYLSKLTGFGQQKVRLLVRQLELQGLVTPLDRDFHERSKWRVNATMRAV